MAVPNKETSCEFLREAILTLLRGQLDSDGIFDEAHEVASVYVSDLPGRINVLMNTGLVVIDVRSMIDTTKKEGV